MRHQLHIEVVMSAEPREFCFPLGHISHRLLENAWFAEPGPAFSEVMYDCGQALAAILLESLQEAPRKVCVMTPAEDADGIAKGVVDHLKGHGVDAYLLCLWNQLSTPFVGGEMVAPILRKYAQDGYDECDQLIAVQSFLGDSTVLKTNITAHFDKLKPQVVHVLAPAMHTKLQETLNRQFPESIHERFRFYTFVYDSDLDAATGELRPGIGGLPAERMNHQRHTSYRGFPHSVIELMQL
jgi:hypothetical protein